MYKTETDIAGVYLIQNMVFSDLRGGLCKYFQKSAFLSLGLESNFKEIFYTISTKDVIRAMHFQNPPTAHEKLVHVVNGAVLDVILDLRKTSPTYGKCFSTVLSAETRNSVFIPVGCAHGYKVLQDNTVTIYHTTTEFDASDDDAVRWDSFGFDWGVSEPILSQKDKNAILFCDYESPFE